MAANTGGNTHVPSFDIRMLMRTKGIDNENVSGTQCARFLPDSCVLLQLSRRGVAKRYFLQESDPYPISHTLSHSRAVC
jgi:hypothetical protein